MSDPAYKGLNVVHRNAIKAFEEAVRLHDNMGAMPPEDHAAIQEQYEYAKANLAFRIKGLYKPR